MLTAIVELGPILLALPGKSVRGRVRLVEPRLTGRTALCLNVVADDLDRCAAVPGSDRVVSASPGLR